MTIPVKGWWVLRRAPGKRQPPHFDQPIRVEYGVHRQAFSSEPQFGFEMRQRFAKMAASEVQMGNVGRNRVGRAYKIRPRMAKNTADGCVKGPEILESKHQGDTMVPCGVPADAKWEMSSHTRRFTSPIASSF